ncbi:MAG: hypothetical protein Q7J60_09070 [Bradyrhizobium sp.]|nr:hypothetical protein [Bradyrhizobium sp.]
MTARVRPLKSGRGDDDEAVGVDCGRCAIVGESGGSIRQVRGWRSNWRDRAPAPGKAAEPESLPLAQIGDVVGDSDAIAIFFDRNDQKADTSEIAAERQRQRLRGVRDCGLDPVPLVDATMGGCLVSVSGRGRRLVKGWSANLFQLILGITQQVALIPVFLHFWTSDMLAAWLVIYAAGNLVMIADGGLQFRALNRFFSFKSSVDSDGRTAHYYAAMLRVYFGFVGLIIALALIATQLLRPSDVLGFRATPEFDTSFIVMVVSALLTLPVGLASALYRARGFYSRVVWLQCAAMLIAQLGQLVAIVTIGSLLAVTVAYAATQLLIQIFIVAIDVRLLFPFLRGGRARQSWRWGVGQFRKAFPFGIAGGTELALQNLPMLLVSAIVIDRVAVAQWGLTRVVAGLVRALCTQVTLPLAAELGHDHAVGAKERLRHLYARGSVFVTVLASIVIAGLLSFWPDFFALWTHGTIPYDPVLTMTLLIGTGVIAPSILALGLANYSNRGALLARTKGLQLAVFVILAIVLTPPMGPLGTAIAIVASDVVVQFGMLGVAIIGQALQRPYRHIAFLALLMILVILGGWAIGTIIRSYAPGAGLARFVFECTAWLIAVALLASPLASGAFRDRLIARIPK